MHSCICARGSVLQSAIVPISHPPRCLDDTHDNILIPDASPFYTTHKIGTSEFKEVAVYLLIWEGDKKEIDIAEFYNATAFEIDKKTIK